MLDVDICRDPRLEGVLYCSGGNLHSAICPLCLLHDIQAGMDNELVHVLRRVWEAEAGNAIAATFGCAEGNVEDRRVCWRENCEVV